MKYTINFTNDPTREELEALCRGLENHAKQTLGKTSFEPFGFLVHDSNKKLIAGCTGNLMYGYLHIRLLWVDEFSRGKGIGKQLLEKAENYAKEMHCRYAAIETFNWQAKTFYEKMGYAIEHVYEDYDDNHQFYFFRKKL